ncbi:cytochrome P450 [Agrobacterium larrymoorei]|uniref:Cytochrome P450 n=1 Tax=Agrobacterium larrymoorei TaxID=160699 RepID=A0A4D7DVH7_9HYPH|nr:cytochrome P450 [Agrobacterium larrymoorei]QCJ01082.1 cytochrome P450 [Agrobacterium larrymoorei]QYA10099.1 cytochrome P450 [Agrobacterium larrymoorei]
MAKTERHGGYWVIAGYDEVFQVARDDDTFSSAGGTVVPNTNVGRLLPIMADPPELERYRTLINPFLTPKAIKEIEPFIRRITDDAIDSFIEQGSVDIVAELASPIPAMGTMRLLGLDPSEWCMFAEPLHDVMYTRPGTPENEDGQRRVLAFSQKIVDEIDERIRAPREDMISRLLASESNGIKTSRQEVIDLVRMVIFGGMDTVVAALGNIFLQLDRHPDIRQRLIADRALLPTAIEEFLRFEAPIQGFGRKVMRDTCVGDQSIKAGETVFMLWASANRDESVFGETADQLVIDRVPNRHMTFGIGGHRCQGSTMARTELRIVLDRVLERLPDYKVVWDKVVGPDTVGSSYGQRAVPILFTPGRKLNTVAA